MLARRKALSEKASGFDEFREGTTDFFRLNDELTLASQSLLYIRRENDELRAALARARDFIAESSDGKLLAEIDAALNDNAEPSYSMPKAEARSHL
jgi:hypothetical protein